MIKLKIIIVGPSKSGKSTIANFLSEAIDYTDNEYRATPGCRLLEFEVNTKNAQAEIELWDCSGDQKYECYWSVFLWNAHGVILVYNPEDDQHVAELERLYEQFITNSTIPKNNTLIICHSKDPDAKNVKPEFSGEMSKVSFVDANVMENSEELKTFFEKYISTVLIDARDFDQDDLNLITMPI